MMEFKAREVYKNKEVVEKYDQMRFSSVKGRVTDWLEKWAVIKAILWARLKPGATILDIPCGTGRLSCYLAERNYRIIASDISFSMITVSRSKIQELKLRDTVDYAVVDAANLPFLNTALNVVVSLRLFGHAPPPIRVQMVKEFARVSQEYIIVAYYHKNCLQGFLRKQKRHAAKIPWYPVTFSEIAKELEEAGLEQIKSFPIFLAVSETIVILAKKKN